MAGEDNFKIPGFDGQNFGLWKRRVQVVLKTKGLGNTLLKAYRGVDDAQEVKIQKEVQDTKAQAILLGAMEQSVMQKVISCETAADIWERLHQVYENTSPASVGKIFEQYYSYKKDSKDDMATHISKVESLAIHLEQVGEKQSEVSIMSKLLHSLPSSYEALKEAWDSVHPTLQTRSNLIARMLSNDASSSEATEASKDVALVVRKNDKTRNDASDRAEKMKKAKCFNCGKIGHYKRDCRSKATNADKDKGDGTASNIALVLKTGDKSDCWVVDSGSSRHTCCRRDWFATFSSTKESLQVGNEEWVHAVGQGSIKIRSVVGGDGEEIELKNVLYIPEMSYNLFSTGKAAERGAVTVIHKKGCQVKLNNRVIATGGIDSETGLCMLNVSTVAGVAMLVSTRRTLVDWHRALGHVDPKVIAEMLANRSVDGMELVQDEVPACTRCPEGKATRAPHTVASSSAITAVGDQVDLDLVGPLPVESLGKARYLLVTKDRFSGYSWVCPIKSKSKDDVCGNLQWYIGQFEAKSGKRIRSFLTDNGSEFKNEHVKRLLDVEHIDMRFASAYTPEQNGGAERNNRVIIEAVRTMLAESGLPQALWAEAAATAAYLRNRVPKRGTKVTPFELFQGRKPFVGHLVPFGTPVQRLINDRRLNKLDPRTEAAFVVGFTDRSNTYRVFIPSTEEVKSSCDVIFRGHNGIGAAAVDRGPGQTQVNDVSLVYASSTPEVGVEGEQNAPTRAIDAFFEELDRRGASEHPTDQENVTPEQGGIVIGGDIVQGNDAEEEEIESPSYSTLTNLSTGHAANTGEASANAAEDSQRAGRDAAYPDLTAEVLASPFRGSTIPRSPTRPRGPTILLNHGKRIEVAPEPANYKQAVSGHNARFWSPAIKAELGALNKCNTWSIVKRPVGCNLLSTKWIFSYKRDSKGNVLKGKARLVARGFEQKHGIDYNETFAPVARMDSVRTLLAIAAAKGLSVGKFDVATAFLNGPIDGDVYIEPPEGVKLEPDQCLKLRKALYGLKQAPKVWNNHFNDVIKQMGFKPTVSDPCVYQDGQQRYLTIYVDDGLVLAPSQRSFERVVEELNKWFETKHVISNVFLGIQMEITQNRELHLCQSRYVNDILEAFNMVDCKPVSKPLADMKILFDKQEDEEVDAPYRSAIGMLSYLAMSTRPDIAFTASLLARFNNSPKRVHWAAVKRVMQYLKGTADVGLRFPKGNEITIEAYSDADWGGDLEKRHSTSGLLIKLCGCPIIFASRRQEGVSQSTAEAEFVAANDVTKELCWLIALLGELKISHKKAKLFIDNKSAIQMIKNHDITRRAKHIEIKYNLVRLKYEQGLFEVEHIDGQHQIADFLTKPLGGPTLKENMERANVIDKQAVAFGGRDRGGVLRKTITPPGLLRRLCG